MKTLLRVLVIFLAITGATALAYDLFQVEFGVGNYWDSHGVFFLIAITIFPRLTLLFSSVASGGWLWWLSWIFAPRILVACLATVSYWNANPVLVVCAWLVALSGESSEKYAVVRRPSNLSGGYRKAKWVKSEVER
jgi:hypothetical protein